MEQFPKRIYGRTCECGECKKCKHRAYVLVWQAANPDKVKATRQRTYEKNKERRQHDVKAWQEANPERARQIKRKYHVKNRFGLTWEQYEALLAVRGDTCWICESSDPKRGRTTMCVDHDHQTGAVRGLLCYDCNDGLGRFKDQIDLLSKAAAYLGGDMS